MSRLPDPSEVAVLIPAAGMGERLGLGPKATLPLAGRPVVDWVVDKARQLGHEVLVACAPGMAAPAGATRAGARKATPRKAAAPRKTQRTSR